MITLLRFTLAIFFLSSPVLAQTEKTYSLTAQPLGYGPSDSFTLGVTAGYYIDADSIVLIEAMGNLYSSGNDDTTSGRTINRTGRSFGAHFKRFISDNFYVKAGFDQRELSLEYTEGGTTAFNASSTVFSIAVGHQWHISNFTIGCDWLGAVIPVSSSLRNESVTGTITTSHQERVDDFKLSNTTRTLAQFGRVYLGATF
jgi:hypothetical protein